MPDIPLPKNLGLLIGRSSYNETACLKKIFEEQLTLHEILITLSRCWKVKAWFSDPVNVYCYRSKTRDGNIVTYHHGYKEVTEHVFSGFFETHSGLYYPIRRHANWGWLFPINKLIRYEPVIKRSK